MRRRAIHLASLLLLLASLGAADAQTLRDGDLLLGAHCISVLLAQQDALLAPGEPHRPGCGHEFPLGPPAAALARGTAWAVRPPVAQTIAQHAVTGNSL